MIALAHLFIS